MAELRLPHGPAELFEAVRETIGEHLGGEHHMRLGGGTALAARWAHRHSTDVDLFVRPEPFERLFENHHAFEREIHQRQGDHASVYVEEGFAKIILGDGGEISLSTSRARTAEPRSLDTVRGTDVPLETNAEIIAKKVRYRMLRNGLIVPRDLYDIAVSRRRDPGAFKTALEKIRTSQLEDIRTELYYLSQDWLARHPQRLIRPAYPADAKNAVAIVRGQLRQEIQSRQPPPPYRPPPAWER